MIQRNEFFVLSERQTCKIYYGKCQCREDYVRETIRYTRWSEHNNQTSKSKPAEHIKTHIEHLFR